MSALLTLSAALRWPQIARPAELNPNTLQRSTARTARSAGKQQRPAAVRCELRAVCYIEPASVHASEAARRGAGSLAWKAVAYLVTWTCHPARPVGQYPTRF